MSLQILLPEHAVSQDEAIARLNGLSPLRPFAAVIFDFIQALSQRILNEPECKGIPELVALGFWLRSSNIRRICQLPDSVIYKALGTVVHFTPANVDTMFIYSWVCSLLMGNKNIVRVSSSESEAKTQLLHVLNQLFLLPEYRHIAQRNLFVGYPRDSQYSGVLSLLADARVIWGGDDSVNTIRSLATRPRCRDISFADRYSAALINGDALNSEQQIAQLAELLWRDTQPYDQQACSSPRLIFWLGNTIHQAELFTRLDGLASMVDIPVTQRNQHLLTSQLIQSTGEIDTVWINQTISVLSARHVTPAMLDWHSGGGLFLVQSFTAIEQLVTVLGSKLQTLSYWQVSRDEILKLIDDPSITGVDRIVPLGQALDFSPVWDGYQILSELSRQITIK